MWSPRCSEPSGPGVWTHHTGAEVGWRGCLGGPQGLVQRLGCLEGGGGFFTAPGGASGGQAGGAARGTSPGRRSLPGSPMAPGLARLGSPLPACLSCSGGRCPAGARLCLPELLCGGQSQRRPGGAGRLPRTILGASSVGPRLPRQMALSTRLGHCLEGAQTAS